MNDYLHEKAQQIRTLNKRTITDGKFCPKFTELQDNWYEHLECVTPDYRDALLIALCNRIQY